MKTITRGNVKRLSSYIKRNGIKASAYKVIERLGRDEDEKDYGKSGDVFDLIASKEEEEYEREMKFTHRYRLSILVPAYETGKKRITEMIESVVAQTYNSWELCIADASKTDEVEEAVNEIMTRLSLPDENLPFSIKYVRVKENGGISENTNEALKMATGEYIALLDHDDVLTRNALFEMAMVLEKGLIHHNGFLTNSVKLIYSDEDKCNDELNEFFDYHKKPDFDIDLLRTNNYICHFLMVRRELALEVGGLNKEFDGAQDHDFILRCVEKLDRSEIVHIKKVLYHWRSHVSSTATNPDSKLYAYDAGKRAVKAHLERCNIKAEVTDTEHLGFYRVKYKVSAEELTQICIMTYDELKSTSKEVLNNSDYKYIMVLNDNVLPLNPDFLEEMLGILLRDEVGCVGGLVLNKNKIESAGYSVSEDGALVPDFKGLNKNFSGYLHRAKLTREVAGVCTDCMMVKKSAILEEGGLNPDKLVVYCPYSVFKRVK